MKAKKVLGLALSAMMAISAVVPWTGLTASAEDTQPASAPAAVESKKPHDGANIKLDGATVTFVTEDGKVDTKTVGRDQLEVKKNAFWEDGDLGIWRSSATVTLKTPEGLVPDGYEFVSCDSPKTVSLTWDWTHWDVVGKVNFTVVVKEKEPETVEITVKYVDEEQNPIEGVDSMTFEVLADTDLAAWADKHYDKYVKSIEGYEVVTAITNGTSIIVKYQKVETPVEPEPVELWDYEVEYYLDGEYQYKYAFGNQTEDRVVKLDVNPNEFENAELQYVVNTMAETVGEPTDNTFKLIQDNTVFEIYYATKETPVDPEPVETWDYEVEYYLDGEYQYKYAFGNQTEDRVVKLDVNPNEFENAELQYVVNTMAETVGEPTDNTFKLIQDNTVFEIYYATKDAPAQDMTLNMTYADIDSDKVLGHGAAVISSDTDLTAWINEQYTGNIITYDGVQYVYTGVYASTANDTTINATLYYREVEVAEEDREIQLTFVDADDQTKVLGHGAGVVPAGETSEAWIYNVYNGDVIEYAGAKYVYTGSNTIVENEDGITATLLYRKAEVVEKDREIQLTFVDIDSNKTLGHGAGVVPAGEASEAWIYNVYNGDVITFENEKYTYTGANTIVENETSITATLYYKKAEVVGEDKEIQLTFVDADDQTKVLGHGAGVVLAGQTVEEWLNEVYPIGDVIEYAGAKYAYTGANAIVEGEDSFTATLLYRKTEALEKDKEIQLIFVDADNQTKVLGRGAGVVLAGQSIEEWLDEVYPIGDVITHKNEKYVYTGSKSVVEGEDSITATLLYRKAEVVEKDREIQLTFVDIDSNKTLGHGAGVVPAGEASEAWIYNVYNGDVITFENEKYTYTGANTIVENETSITATLYYKKAEVVGEDKEIQLTFVDADDQTKVLGHGAGVVLAGQTVEEWLNEVYPIGDVIEYAGAKYAYTGANAIVEGEDSFTATLLYRKTEALEKDKEIQLIFVDADNQTKVLGRGAGVVLAGQSIEEWLDEVYPIGDVITHKNEKYVYTGSKSVVEGEDSITATLLYRKDTDPTDPDEPDEPDPDRPSSGGGYYPSRPDEEEIDDPTTPEASDPGTTPGGGSAGPGGAGDGAVAVEDPTDTLGDNDVPRVNAPQTGRKIAGSIALLAGAAAVAVVTLKKRKDK